MRYTAKNFPRILLKIVLNFFHHNTRLPYAPLMVSKALKDGTGFR